jgi:hypothetical protein
MQNDLVITATFDPPDAQARYQRWRDANRELLEELPPEAVRIDTGRAVPSGTFIRVWLPPDALGRVSPG